MIAFMSAIVGNAFLSLSKVTIPVLVHNPLKCFLNVSGAKDFHLRFAEGLYS